MRRIRNGLIFILTAAMIVLWAMMPRITAKVQDSLSDENIEYGDIKTVTFQKELNTIEKLFLLRDGLRVTVSEENTSKTMTQIVERVKPELYYYFDMEMLYTLPDYFEVTAEPVMFWNNDSRDISWIFWMVTMTHEDTEEIISMWVDDETEEVFLISYETNCGGYDEASFENCMDVFFYHHLDSLQLYEVSENHAMDETLADTTAFEPYVSIYQELGINKESAYKTKTGGLEYNWHIGDAIYGELNLYFYVYSNGFSVSLA